MLCPLLAMVLDHLCYYLKCLVGGADHCGHTLRPHDLRVHIRLTGRDVPSSRRELGLEPHEQALGAADDVRKPRHHELAAVNLEAEVSFGPEGVHDLPTKLSFCLSHCLLLSG